ncbi:MAG TPA: alpha/beta fold hydrolase [Dongiaceae bacterium]|nr:alpha/beta fold hydrolase [Dongiaceae bacterium]
MTPALRAALRILALLLFFPMLLSAVAGWMAAPGFLHPQLRQLTPDLVRDADVTLRAIGAQRESFDLTAPDGAPLRGWKIHAPHANGAWVLVFHGVADNRYGMMEHARMLLLAGYGVVLMDARAHGASGGAIATYGWLERRDAGAVIDRLQREEHPAHLYALGNSMGAGIALQAAGADPRIEAVAAEAPFASLREATYDYAGLQKWPLLGKTLFAPGAWLVLYRGERLAGFDASAVSPERAVAARAFPILLICDGADVVLPCRHAQMIFRAAAGPRELWRVPGAAHTAALGTAPDEFRSRVIGFFDEQRAGTAPLKTGEASPDRTTR